MWARHTPCWLTELIGTCRSEKMIKVAGMSSDVIKDYVQQICNSSQYVGSILFDIRLMEIVILQWSPGRRPNLPECKRKPDCHAPFNDCAHRIKGAAY